ncbi:CRISPR-associated RAMP protein [filamentous cyanobacterium CCT1]|nr:CRISPR-associated RAMP protein [filamentous cyanobacterium CCT1]PSN79789.1 CRISPR-associated RAMP protein [filamentous cyanobacterium CCP4]
MFDVFKSRLELSGTLTTVTALRISQGRSTEPIGSDLPVVKDSLGRPLIPGSSFKGALRSRLESFVRGINSQEAIDPSELVGPTKMRWLKEQKKLYENNDAALTTALLKETDLVSQVFGSPWAAGKFQVRDLTVLPDLWFGQYQERDGVSIDRDTETASEGKLYDFQVVPAGTPFEFKAVVENAKDWELGLLMVGLYQFENEMIPLGGGRSRGLGVVKLNLDEMMWVNPSNPQELIDYLRHLMEGQLQSYIKTPQQIEDLKRSWSMSLLNHLTQLSTEERIHA